MNESRQAEASGDAGAALSGPLSGRLVRGLTSIGSGRLAAALLEFAAIAVLAGRIGPSGVGIYTFAVGLVTLFRLVPNFGLMPVATRDIAQAPERERALIPNVIYLRLVLGAVAYALLAGTVLVAGYSVAARDAALVAGLVLVLLPLDAFQITLQVRLQMSWISRAVLVQSVVNLGGVVVLTGAGASVTALLALYVAAHVLSTGIIAAAAVRRTSYRWRLDTALWSPLVRAALPLALALLLVTLYTRLDMAVLTALKPAAEAGQYGVAYRFMDAFLLLSPIMMSVLAPVLARSQDDPNLLRRRYRRALHLIMVLALPVAVLGPLTAWRLIPALPGFAEFDGAGVALAIMAPGAAIIIVGTVVQGTLIGAHLQGMLLRVSLAGLAFNLALIAVLIPWLSYAGAAIATTLTEALTVGLSVAVARRRLGVMLPLDRAARLLVPLALSALVAVATLELSVFVQLPAAVVAYVLGVVAVRAVRRDDLTGLPLRGAGRIDSRVAATGANPE